MRNLIEVTCQSCDRPFHKYAAYVKENAKLGHNLYCSKECQFNYRKTGKLLPCDNPTCKKGFYRAKNDILKYNFCSQSCAAIVNNQRYPKWPKRYCVGCKKEFKNRSSNYCSNACGQLAISNYRSSQSKYSREEIIIEIKDFFLKQKRVPAKRELADLIGCATNKFGSWNNAIVAADLIPNRSHNNRMYKRHIGRAGDGHKCDSTSEILIDNWLHKNNVSHDRNVPYPNTNHRADWSIKNGKVFIEYFGLAKDSPRYDRSIKEKIALCKKSKIKLIGIYPDNLYPVNKLDKLLSKII